MKGIPFLSKLQGIKLIIKGLDLGAGLGPYKTLLSTSPPGVSNPFLVNFERTIEPQ